MSADNLNEFEEDDKATMSWYEATALWFVCIAIGIVIGRIIIDNPDLFKF